MTQTSSKKIPKVYILAALGLLFPIFLVGMAFVAAKSDVETKRKYDQMRQQHAEKMELKKQQEQQDKPVLEQSQKDTVES